MKISIYDGRILRGLYGALNRAIDRIPKIEDRINKKYDKIVYNGLKAIADNAIDEFYNSYTPYVYRRKNDLYNAYQITTINGDWSIDVDAQYMKKQHNQDNQLVYWLAMNVGSHGGFPHNGDYYWRWPSPVEAAKIGKKAFSEWYSKPASSVAGFAPENIENSIIDESQKYIDSMADLQLHEFESMLRPIIDDIKDRISRLA